MSGTLHDKDLFWWGLRDVHLERVPQPIGTWMGIVFRVRGLTEMGFGVGRGLSVWDIKGFFVAI